MFNLVVFILLYMISTGVLLLEEEVLIIIASVFWLDAAGVFIKKYLDEEIEGRGLVIKKKILWYYNKKISVLREIREFYIKKVYFSEWLSLTYNNYLLSLVESIIILYLKEEKVILKDSIKNDLVGFGLYLINEIFIESLEIMLLKYKTKEEMNLEFNKELKYLATRNK